MLIIAALIAIAPVATPSDRMSFNTKVGLTKKKGKATSSSSGRKFRSCKAARAAGYTHMRRGRPGYSTALDRDGDGVACDKVG